MGSNLAQAGSLPIPFGLLRDYGMTGQWRIVAFMLLHDILSLAQNTSYFKNGIFVLLSKGLVVGDLLYERRDGNPLPIFTISQPGSDNARFPRPIPLK